MAKESTGYVGINSKGKWFARVTFTGDNGKRKNIVRTANDKADARRLLKALLTELDGNERRLESLSKITFCELADYYEAKFVKAAKYVNERKVEGLRDTIHIRAFLRVYREFFGAKKVRDITYSDLCAFKTQRLQTPTRNGGGLRSLTTVNRELTALRRIFNIAVQENWLTKNPFKAGESLIQVSAERKRERILTVEEEERLLAACDNKARKHLKPFLIALLATGCRKSELTLLKWRDVDLDQRLITIQALNTKSLRSRKIAITNKLYAELSILWDNSDKLPDRRVFGIQSNVRKAFSSACKIAGIKEGGIDGLSLHSFRHSVAVRLVKGNLPIQLVGRILGHSQLQTTYRYLSANEQTLFEAASILDSHTTS
jgi:integrase